MYESESVSHWVMSHSPWPHGLAARQEFSRQEYLPGVGSHALLQGIFPCQGYILLPHLVNLDAEYIMWNAQLDLPQTGIKIAGRNINNLKFADDTTLMSESERN